MKKLRVNLGDNSYDIIIKENLLLNSGAEIREVSNAKKVIIVTDSNVAPLYLDIVKNSLEENNFEVYSKILPAGEQSKDLSMLSSLYNAFLEANISRSDLIIALGGGVVGDITGFASATYLRGVPYVQVATTLLAQVDSSVGGKTAADLPQGKNLVGAFYQPKKVLIDPNVLNTLDEHFYKDGMGEVIKYGCIWDKEFFEQIFNNDLSREEMIYKCCKIKAEIVERDEKDTSVRMLLNFGHTLGHAIETYYKYEKYSHGEAVAMGMYAITSMSEQLKITEQGTADKVKEVLIKNNLNYEMPLIDRNQIIEAVSHDKKNLNNKLNFILLKKIGESFIYDADVKTWGGLKEYI